MKLRWSVALISTTLIALEIVWTRVFSAEFFYTFAFFILSLAMLGLGLGALMTRLAPAVMRIRIPVLVAGGTLFALAAPPAVVHLGLDFSRVLSSWTAAGAVAGSAILLAAPFFLGGMALARIFREHVGEMPSLYMADLAGAGAGIALAILSMNYAGTAAAVFIVCLPMIAAAALMWERPLAIQATAFSIAAAAMAAGLIFADPLMNPPRKERAPVIIQHWDAMARLKVYDFAPDYRGLNIDNAANSPVLRFDGNWNRPDSSRFEFGIDISYLIRRTHPCTFMSLGSGGGGDVLQALQEGATEIHAVEVNPAINRMLLDGELAEFSGHIYSDPRVIVASEDARSYVRRFSGKFDVIFSLSSNTFAALASGSFAMAENYLFTREAFEDYYCALADSGVLVMEHQFYAPRLAAEALQALEHIGVPDPQSHIAVYDLPKMHRNVLLLSRLPVDDTLRFHALGNLTGENYPERHLLYPAPDSTAANLVNRIVTQGWQSVQGTAQIDVSPASDDRPFTPQLGLWRNVKKGSLENIKPWEFYGFPLAKLVIAGILALAVLVVLPLTLFVPRLRKGRKLPARACAYFAAIGIAFMFVEVVLIQQYTLFIGPASSTIAAILLALLTGAGLGSRFANRFPDVFPFIAIPALVLLDAFLFPFVPRLLGASPAFLRILATVIILFPLGFAMGMPFPKGSMRVGELVDWGFAVNGAASVIGSAAVMLISFELGFTAALVIAAVLYGLAWIFLPAQERA